MSTPPTGLEPLRNKEVTVAYCTETAENVEALISSVSELSTKSIKRQATLHTSQDVHLGQHVLLVWEVGGVEKIYLLHLSRDKVVIYEALTDWDPRATLTVHQD